MSRRRTYSNLIAINAVALAALLAVTIAPIADANNQSRRARGEYTMVSGRVQGLPESAVYIIDAANQEMLAVRFNRSRQSIEGIGYRNMADDARAAQQQRGGGRR